MTENTQKKFRRAMWWLKPLLAVAALSLILQELTGVLRQDWWSAFLSSFGVAERLPWLVAAILLMPFNWFWESVKWRRSIRHLEGISLATSFKAVLSGVSVSVFLPNRIGEYAGRVFVLQKADRIQAALCTMVAAFAQLVVTLLAGTIAFTFYRPVFFGSLPLLMVSLVLCLAALTFYLFIGRLSFRLPLRFLPASWSRYTASLGSIGTRLSFTLLLHSFFRYAVFCVQFICLLRFFGVDIHPSVALECIALTYLVMAVVPTIALTELGVRGAVAVMVFAPFTDRSEEVVFASSLLWLVNLILPALVGCLFILRWRIFRDT